VNEFEFMRDLPIGQYLPGDSILHRLDPRTRIVAAVVFLLALTFEGRTLGLAFALLAALAAWRLAQISAASAWRGWRAALPFLLILAVLQVFWHGGPDRGAVVGVVLGKAVTSGDLLLGLNLLLRFSAYILALGLASALLSAADITRGLDALLKPLERLRLPVHDFVMVIQVTLRFFPLLGQTVERIAKAQASRGANWDAKGNILQRVRQVVPILVPLFVISLRRAESLALAMDARAYGSSAQRTSMVELKFARRDWLALAVLVGVVGVMIAL